MSLNIYLYASVTSTVAGDSRDLDYGDRSGTNRFQGKARSALEKSESRYLAL